MNADASTLQRTVARPSGTPAGAADLQLRQVMAGLRGLCAQRSAVRAGEFAERLSNALTAYRYGIVDKTRGFGELSAVSTALDDFVSEVKTGLDLQAGHVHAQRIESHLGVLTQMYVMAEEGLALGTVSRDSFMVGSDMAAANVTRLLQSRPGDARQDPPLQQPRHETRLRTGQSA